MEVSVSNTRKRSTKPLTRQRVKYNAERTPGRLWVSKEMIPSFPTLDELNEAFMGWDSIKPLTHEDLTMALIY